MHQIGRVGLVVPEALMSEPVEAQRGAGQGQRTDREHHRLSGELAPPRHRARRAGAQPPLSYRSDSHGESLAAKVGARPSLTAGLTGSQPISTGSPTPQTPLSSTHASGAGTGRAADQARHRTAGRNGSGRGRVQPAASTAAQRAGLDPATAGARLTGRRAPGPGRARFRHRARGPGRGGRPLGPGAPEHAGLPRMGRRAPEQLHPARDPRPQGDRDRVQHRAGGDARGLRRRPGRGAHVRHAHAVHHRGVGCT